MSSSCPVCSAALTRKDASCLSFEVCAARGTFFDAHELARGYQAFATKRAVDDADPEEFARDLTEARRDSVLRHTWWGASSRLGSERARSGCAGAGL